MKSDKKETIAEKFIRERRTRYAEMYPTDFHFLLRLLSSPDDNWDKRGRIICTYKDTHQPLSLTKDGWESAKNVIRCPTHWPEPDTRSAILNIPDNADDSWLHEISMFIYHLEKWEQEHVETWITTSVRLSGMGLTYQEDSIRRNLKGYRAVRAAIFDGKVRERIRLIENNRHLPKVKKVPQVEVGATVRFHTGVDEAIVSQIIYTSESRYVNHDGKISLCVLDSEINGSTIHVKENLIATKFPKEKTTNNKGNH